MLVENNETLASCFNNFETGSRDGANKFIDHFRRDMRLRGSREKGQS